MNEGEGEEEEEEVTQKYQDKNNSNFLIPRKKLQHDSKETHIATHFTDVL